MIVRKSHSNETAPISVSLSHCWEWKRIELELNFSVWIFVWNLHSPHRLLHLTTSDVLTHHMKRSHGDFLLNFLALYLKAITRMILCGRDQTLVVSLVMEVQGVVVRTSKIFLVYSENIQCKTLTCEPSSTWRDGEVRPNLFIMIDFSQK